jgi:hypothetical protein
MFISSFHKTENQNNSHYAKRICKTKEGTYIYIYKPSGLIDKSKTTKGPNDRKYREQHNYNN